MTEYTPSTKEVQRVYVLAPDNLAQDGKPEWSMYTQSQFDRWLAEHDRQVAERAWDEGRQSVGVDMTKPLNADGMKTPTTNPYRTVYGGAIPPTQKERDRVRETLEQRTKGTEQ